MLSKPLLFAALAQLRHSKWFQVYLNRGQYFPALFFFVFKLETLVYRRPNTMSI